MTTTTHSVIGPEIADVATDGGKWAIYCEHYDTDGEMIYCAILQDSNKARLSAWKRDTHVWCEQCQSEGEQQ